MSLETGAIVRVTVFGHDDLSGEFEIDASGQVTLSLVGDMPVHDRSLDIVEQLFVAALGPDYLRNPQVSVEIVNYQPFCIDEEVASSGSYSHDVGELRTVNAAATTGDAYRAEEKDLLTTRSTGDGRQEKAGRDRPVSPGKVIEAQSGSIDFFMIGGSGFRGAGAPM